MSFSKLRGVLQKEPTASLWAEVCSLFEHWESASDFELGLAYAEEHMSGWPDAWRYMHGFSPHKKVPAWWPLVRYIDYKPAKEKFPKALLKKNFPNITILYLSGSLQTLDGIESFPNVSSLTIRHMTELSDIAAISNLKQLTILDIEGANLENNQGLNHCSSLEELHFKYQTKTIHWVSFIGLKKLRKLHLSCSGMKTLEPLSELTNLQELELFGSQDLESTKELKNLSLLKNLKIHWAPVLREVSGLGELEHLESIFLENCPKVVAIGGIDGELAQLKELSIRHCDELVEVGDLFRQPNLESVTLGSFSSSLALKDLQTCKKLRRLELWRSNISLETSLLPSSLHELYVGEMIMFRKNTSWNHLQDLQSLSIELRPGDTLEVIEGLSKLPNITTFHLCGASELHNLKDLERMDLLEYFTLRECENLHSLEGIERFKNLRNFSAFDCYSLISLKGLQELEHLEHLWFEQCYQKEVGALETYLTNRKDVETFQETVRRFYYPTTSER